MKTMAMKKFTATHFFVSTFIALIGISAAGASLAKEPEVSFYPSQNWAVSKDKNEAGAAQCVISSEYNNGFIVALKGSAQWVQSLNIDFRQGIFNPGETYPITLTVPGQSAETLQAKAVNGTTLQADIRKSADFYNEAAKAGVFDFALDSNNFRFYLTRFNNEQAGFEQCMAMQQGDLRQAADGNSAHSGADELRVNESMAYEQDEAAVIATEEALPEDMQSPVSNDSTQAPMPLTERSATPEESNMPALEKTDDPLTENRVVTPQTAMTEDDVMTPEPDVISASTPDFEVERQTYKATADFTDLGTDDSAEPFSEPGRGEMARKISDLEDMVKTLKIEKELLEDELNSALRESEQERLSISSDNWNLERATMRYNEAERQADRLGQQLQRERAQCHLEKQELEAMLFDPQVTDQVQLAKLADIEKQLARAKDELESQRLRYEERIRLIEEQLKTN